MATGLADRLITKWHVFSYNFGWATYPQVLDGWVARCAMTVPIIGYLILFNDSVAVNLSFHQLAAESTSVLGLSGSNRLKFIYLGLLALGAANILFRWMRPFPMAIANNEYDFVEKGLKHFSSSNYLQFHREIHKEGRDPYTQHGKYYDAEWQGFYEMAVGKKTGDRLQDFDTSMAHWAGARDKYESLLRSILTETFFRETTVTRRGWLVICWVTAIVGYTFLAIPSVDLFLKVMVVIGRPWLD